MKVQLDFGRLRPMPLSDYITGPHYPDVSKATQALSEQTNSPHIAQNLTIYVKDLSLLKGIRGVQTGSPLMEKEAIDIDKCYWTRVPNSVVLNQFATYKKMFF